ncbi:acyl-CoA dehydrogenase family protein [Novosphingobium album (ex Liu et al. 2023)]|uniref:Acyl-CoA dehydrogenase family protein n=1 Tax=Novosphingobium album (ex Liu et al. 2023) TaxID=3031130 RepID=A0ABT5WX85_9SPHN|nr:acyl-CoA dehydrogenase family protein [Novosphingobium album (ex Liu et al. 2023)]MDE8654511.1 acyl-CoA dehydrogenase family protein [Novosphingobium album (ex Liu et al. 2023)]
MNGDIARLLHDSAERLVSRLAPVPATDAAWAERLPELDAAIAEAGLPLALVPEAQGGLGLGWAEVAVLPRLWGRRAVPRPIIEPLLAARIVHACGLDPQWLGASVAAEADGRIDAAWWPGTTGLLVVDQAGVRGFSAVVPNGADLTGQPRACPAGTAPAVAAGMAGTAELLAGARLLTVAAMLGAMEQARDLALDYARVRTQFGKPLGQFQAVQRLLTQAASEVEAVRAMLAAALDALDASDCPEWLAAGTKARAGQAATVVATHAHQVLGAIGFTEEHELHRSTRRLWCWRDDWGREAACAEAVGIAVAQAGGDGLWPLLTDRHRERKDIA